VKKRTDQRAIIEINPPRQVNNTLRVLRTSVGMIGSEAYLDSMIRKAAKKTKQRSRGGSGISGEDRLKSSRKTDAA
jgi:hypothetical protein